MAQLYVLFVETQDPVLKNIGPGLKQPSADWQSIFVNTAETALDVLSQRDIGVVVANFGADKAGCERFFRDACDRSSTAIRLGLLPEQHKSEVGNFLEFAHQCMALDCGADEITLAIHRGLSVWERSKCNPKLASLLSKLNKLPTPPALYFDLRDHIETAGGNSRSVAQIAARDPALSAKIVRVVNSGFYAMPRTITDLHQAITLLGSDTVLSLVLSLHLFDRLPLPGLNLDSLWKHGMAVSLMAKHIATAQGGDRDVVNASGVAGLLHDLGSLVFLDNIPSQYQSMIRQADGDETILLSLESDNFGVEHAELGSLVLGLWCLPDIIVEAVALHHDSNAVARPEVSLASKAVFLAEWLVSEYVACGGVATSDNMPECPLKTPPHQIEAWWEACGRLMDRVSN